MKLDQHIEEEEQQLPAEVDGVESEGTFLPVP